MKRVVRLLAAPELLTSRQRAQRKYRQSGKGKAALARYVEKKKQDAAWRAAQVARAMRWARTNRTRKRVYHRVWQQTDRRLKSQGANP